MCGLKKVLLVTAVFALEATAQWQLMSASGGNPSKLQRRFTIVPSQQPPSQQHSQQWNNYRSRGQWGGEQTGHQQQQSTRNLQHQRHQNLVDYPFTVEYVDRRAQISLDGSKYRKDENLVDYPFTIEYVNNMNNRLSETEEDRVQASMRSNQDSFQFRTQQQRYQQNNQGRHSAGNHNSDPSLGGHLGGSRPSFHK